MRTLSCLLAVLMLQTAAAADGPTPADQITKIPAGAMIEVRLNTKQKLRGTRGAIAQDHFTLADPKTGEHAIAFADVASVKQINKPHTTRKVLIIVGVAVAAVVIVVVVLFETRGPYVKI